MKSDTGDSGSAAPDDPQSIDSILARFDAAIERLQQPTPAELDAQTEPDTDAPTATGGADEEVDTGEIDAHLAPEPDLEIEVQPVTDDIDVIEQRDTDGDDDLPGGADRDGGADHADHADEGDDRSTVPEYVITDLPDDVDPTAAVSIRGLTKHFDDTIAAENINLDIRSGTIVGIVGPNGAGKTTTLSMITGMLRPDVGNALIAGNDIWKNPDDAKKHLGIVPDRMRVFDRLTGAQLLHYSGVLRGLDRDTARERATQLANALGIADALDRLVDDYSSGMMKKLALATALIHAPAVLVLDEPFEAVDPVSVLTVVDILREFAEAGGAVILSSHSLGLIQDLCDEVAVIVGGRVIAAGTVDDVRGDDTLENRFIALVRDDDNTAEDMEWLHTFSA